MQGGPEQAQPEQVPAAHVAEPPAAQEIRQGGAPQRQGQDRVAESAPEGDRPGRAAQHDERVDVRQVRGERQDGDVLGPDPLAEEGVGHADADKGVSDGVQ